MNIDTLIVTALEIEFQAAKSAFSAGSFNEGVREWRFDDTGEVLLGTFVRGAKPSLIIALARPSRMGEVPAAAISARLVERLKPNLLAMCGVCAGNPSGTSLGDVIIADLVYIYDEGKRTPAGVEPDHRQSAISKKMLLIAQSTRAESVASYGTASQADAALWLLHRLHNKEDPIRSPARARYFPDDTWPTAVKKLEDDGLIQRRKASLRLTPAGRDFVAADLVYNLKAPQTLPFEVHVGPMASGSVVVKDGVTWAQLKMTGVRTVSGLEMEAASLGWVARDTGIADWIVVKGVMDYADPNKDDRYKPFAATAAAEILRRICLSFFDKTPAREPVIADSGINSVNVIGNGNHVVQNYSASGG